MAGTVSAQLPCDGDAGQQGRRLVATAVGELLDADAVLGSGGPARPPPGRAWSGRPSHGSIGPYDELLEDAQLAVTELVANSVRAGCTRLVLSVSLEQDEFLLDVFDDAPGQPVLRPVGPLDTSGRGLHILTALARNWGVEHVDGGKHVWAALALPRAGVALAGD